VLTPPLNATTTATRPAATATPQHQQQIFGPVRRIQLRESLNGPALSENSATGFPCGATSSDGNNNNNINITTGWHPFTAGELIGHLLELGPDRHRATTQECGPLHNLQHQVINNIKQMWVDNTWNTRRQLVNRFHTFCNNNNINTSVNEELDWAIPLFVESTGTSTASKLTYSKTLAALYHRMGAETPIGTMYQTALRASGGLIPTHQAVPASSSQVDKLLIRATTVSPNLVAAIFLLYKTASRWDEIAKIIGKSILHNTPSEIIIEWLDRTKTTRADPFRVSAWTVIHHSTPMIQVNQVLAQLKSEEQLTQLTTAEFTAWVQKDPTTATLSAHSFKRGALESLAMKAAEGLIDIKLLPLLAKHKANDQFPGTTLRYVNNRAALARMLRTQDATQFLECTLPEDILAAMVTTTTAAISVMELEGAAPLDFEDDNNNNSFRVLEDDEEETRELPRPRQGPTLTLRQRQAAREEQEMDGRTVYRRVRLRRSLERKKSEEEWKRLLQHT
jgi:hypothetical protein